MEFFDNARSKAKEAFEIAAQKTEDAVYAGKQKFSIAQLENQRSKAFKVLGELYFNMIADGEIEDPEIFNLVTSIKTKQEEIAKIKADLESRK